MKNYKFKIDDNNYDVDVVSVKDRIAKVNVNGILYEIEVEQELTTSKTPTLVRQEVVPSTDAHLPSQPKQQTKNGAAAGLRSPLPGKIIDIMVKPGDQVHVGQTVICLEAMKMENNIKTDHGGVVTAVNVAKGDIVVEGNILIEIE